MEIFPLEYGFEDFSFWRFVHEDFSFGIFILETELLKKNLMKICSWRFLLEDLFWRFFHWSFGNFYWRFVHWRFFLWNMVLEIFPLKNGDFFFRRFVHGDFPWRFILRDFSIEVLEIFIEDLFIGEFSFWKWRFSFMITKWRRWRWIRNDEDLFMMIFFFFFEKPILWMRTTLAGSWCRLLDKSLLNSYKKIISISNEFFHWNELEVLTQCP